MVQLRPASSLTLHGTGYLDVAKLMSGGSKVKTSYEKLASLIGKQLVIMIAITC